MKCARGFTLVELLVALAIFGVLAAVSLRAISNAADQRAFVENETRKWRDLDRLFAILESDLGAAYSSHAPFIGLAAPGPDGLWLRLTRAGRSEGDDAPVAPRAVAYWFSGGHVARSVGVEDSQFADAQATMRYPSEVVGLRARYLSARGEWLAVWQSNDDSLPRAVEVNLRLATREQVRRVMLLR